MRQIEIVVDGLRHVHHLRRPPALCSNFNAENAVSSPPIVISLLTPSVCKLARQASRVLGFFCVGIGTRRPGQEPPAEVNATDVFDRQTSDLAGVPIHDPFETILNAGDIGAVEDALSSPP